MRIEFLYKLICYESSLPSRTMALRELSMSVGRLNQWHPLRHMIALRGRANLVRMYVIESEYDSFVFSAILLASCFIVRDADGPAPPCSKTRAERSYSSTSSIRCSYLRHFNDSYLYTSTEFFGHDLASGLKIFTSKK